MGYETNEYKQECGCIRYKKTHDFFSDEGEEWFYYCEVHFNCFKYFSKMTKEEYNIYYENNKNRLNANRRQAYLENRDKKLAQVKKYREDNIEKVREKDRARVREGEAERAKKYRTENAEKIAEKKKDKNAMKTVYGCGGKYCYSTKTKHDTTNRHTKWVEEQQ